MKVRAITSHYKKIRNQRKNEQRSIMYINSCHVLSCVFWLPYYDDSNTTLNEEPRMNNAKLTSEEAK